MRERIGPPVTDTLAGTLNKLYFCFNNARRKDLRSRLVEAIRSEMIPIFEKAGFSRSDSKNYSHRAMYPFGLLERPYGDWSQLLTFQFEKYGSPEFHITIGNAPPGGHRFWENQEPVQQSDFDPAWCPDAHWIGYFRLNPSKRGDMAVESSIKNLEKEAVEIIRWFDHGDNDSHFFPADNSRFYGENAPKLSRQTRSSGGAGPSLME
ncbi:hypothetical protein [Qipengyuania vesicularis]|uniref:hypothetical protein n=1 Tax=Qipengyuania vesicularis TaxID=2867232 RepID=UPI001C86E690|nr:hypothetical protein [Qipengyuania vesicularis]MBX7526637.1 hypothetical protein [Qipengyuania vesicularis]